MTKCLVVAAIAGFAPITFADNPMGTTTPTTPAMQGQGKMTGGDEMSRLRAENSKLKEENARLKQQIEQMRNRGNRGNRMQNQKPGMTPTTPTTGTGTAQ